MEARKEAFKQSLKSELALANAQQLINVRRSGSDSQEDADQAQTTNEKCYVKCITKPSSSLSSSEEVSRLALLLIYHYLHVCTDVSCTVP